MALSLCLALAGCGDGGAPAATATASAAPPPVASSAPPPAASSAPVASAGASSAPSAQPKLGQSKAPPYLWEASKDGKTSWFFGTMHTAVDADKDVNRVVFEKFDASDTLFFELDTEAVDPMAAAQMAMMPNGKTIKDKLGPGRWKLLMDRTSSFLMPESTLEHMKPWFLGVLLTQSMLPKTEPLDQALEDRGRALKKRLVFFETAEQQLGILDRSFDVKVLDDMLAELPKVERSTKDMSTHYLSGDAEKLQVLLFDPEDMKLHPQMYEDLLYGRNRAWIPKLLPELAKGNVFVAVGAAHLLGDKSVLRLLEKEGYTFARVPPAP